jgi:polyhydroxybutyrate depolymerase
MAVDDALAGAAIVSIVRGLVVLVGIAAVLSVPAPQAYGKEAKPVQCLSARGRSPHKTESLCMRLELNGATRTYRLYKPRVPAAPKNAKPKVTPMPVLLVLHGNGGSGSTMEQMTLGQLNRIADKRSVIVVYPDGIDRNWNVIDTDGVDDIAFLRAVVDDVEKRQPVTRPVDRQRIYATGFSTGGLMAHRLACDAADFVTAVAPVAANFPVELARRCRPSRTVPISAFNGADDPLMPWLGGEIEVAANRRSTVLSAQETFERWAQLGDCALPNTHMQFRDKSAKGTAVIRHVARDCIEGTEVRLYEIVGGGHSWPSGYQYLSERVAGKVSRDLNASTTIWEFLAKFRLK